MTAGSEYTCKYASEYTSAHTPEHTSEHTPGHTYEHTPEHTSKYTPGHTSGCKSAYASIGRMSMPVNFRYAEIFRRGRPRHGKPGVLSTYDSFYIKHPPMDTVRRAKLFNAFDALSGFGDRVAAKEVLYEERQILTDEEKEELDRRLAIIRSLAPDTRKARENRVRIEVTCFFPCADPESEFFGTGRGQYRTITGIVRKVDTLNRRILLGGESIDLESVTAISGNPLFDQEIPAGISLCPGDTRMCPSETQICPSDARMCPSDTRICPSEARICPSDTRICPSDTRIHPGETA